MQIHALVTTPNSISELDDTAGSLRSFPDVYRHFRSGALALRSAWISCDRSRPEDRNASRDCWRSFTTPREKQRRTSAGNEEWAGKLTRRELPTRVRDRPRSPMNRHYFPPDASHSRPSLLRRSCCAPAMPLCKLLARKDKRALESYPVWAVIMQARIPSIRLDFSYRRAAREITFPLTPIARVIVIVRRSDCFSMDKRDRQAAKGSEIWIKN